MPLFSFDRYTKPGKGVEKNEKPKPAILRFFIVLWNKRFSIFGINSIYVVFSILAVAAAAGVFSGCVALYDMFSPAAELGKKISEDPAAGDFYFRALLFFTSFFTVIPVFSGGPFYAGLTYILKSFYKEEPVFLWHDFITKTRSNLSLGLKVCIGNLLCGAAVAVNTMAYMVIADPKNPAYNATPWFILFIMALVIIFFTVLLLMMNLYVYPMMVTFRVSFKQLLKNCFVLCTVKWLPNLGILLLDALVVGLPIFLLPTGNYVAFVVGLILYLILTPSFVGLINMFYVYPVFKKYLIDNVNADKSGGGEEEAPLEEIPAATGGHFENGMWVEE